MIIEILKVQIEKHAEMFQHYSNLLFKARVLIMTVILLGVIYLSGVKKFEMEVMGIIFKPEPVLNFIFSIVITLLFSMETAYIRRLAEVADSYSKLDPENTGFIFFKTYKPLWHWPLIVLYLIVISYLIYSGWAKNNSDLFIGMKIFLTFTPYFLFFWTILQHGKKIKLFTKKD